MHECVYCLHVDLAVVTERPEALDPMGVESPRGWSYRQLCAFTLVKGPRCCVL